MQRFTMELIYSQEVSYLSRCNIKCVGGPAWVVDVEL